MVFLCILLAILGLLLLLVLFLTVCALLVDRNKFYKKDNRFYRCLMHILAAVVVWAVRAKVHVTGKELIPEGKKLLFVGNHMSNYDPIVTMYAFMPWNLSYVSKGSNFKIPWFGQIVRRCCFMEIDRENPRNAIHTINWAAELLKEQEVSVGVYPEGTRSKSGELLPFHNGVFKIAQKAETDIVVVGLTGTNQIANNTPWKRTHVYVDVLEVIPAADIHKVKTEVIGQRVENLLNENKRKRELS